MRTLFAYSVAFIVSLHAALAVASVNVNSAQQSELVRVKGIDRVKAKSIIEWRAANGSIDNFVELQNVPGFSPDVIDRIKPELAFAGDSYVPPKKEPKKTASAPRSPITPSYRVRASR